MARRENIVATVPLQIALTEGLIRRLTLLVYSGRWGRTTAEAVERIISAKIDEVLEQTRQGIRGFVAAGIDLKQAGFLTEADLADLGTSDADEATDRPAAAGSKSSKQEITQHEYRRFRKFEAFQELDDSEPGNTQA